MKYLDANEMTFDKIVDRAKEQAKNDIEKCLIENNDFSVEELDILRLFRKSCLNWFEKNLYDQFEYAALAKKDQDDIKS